jgi:energy-coupling factor transporter ATP-binding protein EcfA2
MVLLKLILENFGPFKNYELDFPQEEGVCVLLVGKNNEGKSTILRALKLIHDATKVIGKRKYRRIINSDLYFNLLKQDIGDIRIGRLIYNYVTDTSQITGIFSNGSSITVFLDAEKDIVYATYSRSLSYQINLFGFIPPLGPISEYEEEISNINYLKANVNTSLAPRHLRNYFQQLLSSEQFDLVKKIVKTSWEDVELDSFDRILEENRLECFYKENGILREIS